MSAEGRRKIVRYSWPVWRTGVKNTFKKESLWVRVWWKETSWEEGSLLCPGLKVIVSQHFWLARGWGKQKMTYPVYHLAGALNSACWNFFLCLNWPKCWRLFCVILQEKRQKCTQPKTCLSADISPWVLPLRTISLSSLINRASLFDSCIVCSWVSCLEGECLHFLDDTLLLWWRVTKNVIGAPFTEA